MLLKLQMFVLRSLTMSLPTWGQQHLTWNADSQLHHNIPLYVYTENNDCIAKSHQKLRPVTKQVITGISLLVKADILLSSFMTKQDLPSYV